MYSEIGDQVIDNKPDNTIYMVLGHPECYLTHMVGWGTFVTARYVSLKVIILF